MLPLCGCAEISRFEAKFCVSLDFPLKDEKNDPDVFRRRADIPNKSKRESETVRNEERLAV
jgi:hypothetical protein